MPSLVANGVELALGEIAGGGADGVDIGVGRDQRCVRDGRDVPEASFVEMGQVDHDAQPVALAHQRFAEIGQSGAGVGRAPGTERGRRSRTGWGATR